MKDLTIGLVYDSQSEYLAQGYTEEQVAECDSDSTINILAETIGSLGCRVVRIGNLKALCGRLVAGERWDLVFTIAEGLNGRSREAQVPAILEAYGIPYTFSDPLVCAITLDKAVAKRLIQQAGLNTPNFYLVRTAEDLAKVNLRFPLFAKPVAEGTGKGIDSRSRVESVAELKPIVTELLNRYHQPVLVEEYLPGREFTTAILGNGDKARVLGTMEIEVLPQAANAIYSYETKEKCETQIRYSALQEPTLAAEIEKLALAAYLTLECHDAGRVDIRLDGDGKPSFMEINPIPGIHPTHSDLPMIATQQGMAYPKIIEAIIHNALSRQPGVK